LWTFLFYLKKEFFFKNIFLFLIIETKKGEDNKEILMFSGDNSNGVFNNDLDIAISSSVEMKEKIKFLPNNQPQAYYWSFEIMLMHTFF
jgi:hypothetical protein